MKSLSGVGVGLSAVFGCLLLALLAELYYLLYCKNKKNSSSSSSSIQKDEENVIFSCCKNHPTTCLVHDPQPQPNKPLSLPPRFLFTITEETREDLESEDGVAATNLLQILDTPFLTPTASPPYYTPPLTPILNENNHNCLHRFTPFLEAERDAEFNRMLRSSPPPKFKFLRDAEDKMIQRNKLMGQIEIACGLENGSDPPQR